VRARCARMMALLMLPSDVREEGGELKWFNVSSNGLERETVRDYRTSHAVRRRVATLWHSTFTEGLGQAIGAGLFALDTPLFVAAVAVRREADRRARNALHAYAACGGDDYAVT
jgi:hypothetical protein